MLLWEHTGTERHDYILGLDHKRHNGSCTVTLISLLISLEASELLVRPWIHALAGLAHRQVPLPHFAVPEVFSVGIEGALD